MGKIKIIPDKIRILELFLVPVLKLAFSSKKVLTKEHSFLVLGSGSWLLLPSEVP